jgi:NAD(P)-dependent dehydrogenase (short-subunit alcohol dehydrogenase family)
VAIVTGAAGLLGEQYAIALADCGSAVVLADLDVETCRERARRLASRDGVRAIAVRCDVTDRDSWQALLDGALAAFGRVDILVNNAGYTNQSRTANYDRGFADFPLEDWNQILGVNLTGSLLGCQVVGGRMAEQRAGSIINIASLYGVVSPNHRMYPGTGVSQPVAYSVSKSGVIALTRYLATLWADRGVRVNCITPGGVNHHHGDEFVARYSALCPMGRMAGAGELRGALIYLASAASAYCTGHNLIVDGGWTAW